MGWTFFHDNRAKPGDILARELSDTNDAGAVWSIVDHATRGREWYAVQRVDKPGADPVFYGLVVLFTRKNGEFGYKDMTECMGPYYYNAPARLLNMLDKLAPNAPQSAIDWRAKCRATLADKRKPKRKLAPGSIVEFPNVKGQFELIMPNGPRRGWSVRYVGGSMSYTANARQIAQCSVIA
jgi:hypothetical protein